MSDVLRVVEAKRDGKELSEGQLVDIVDGFTKGVVPDYQMSAFLMAIVCRGMTNKETIHLTQAMLGTGEILNLSVVPGIKVDKHSTGGVGDKVSLALVPIAAAGGVPIAKMSGRGLGHTGGTLDKLESISGFRTALTAHEIVRQTVTVGGCLCAQTDNIAPADKKMYGLRDVSGTVESIPLIATSIMSKKLAGGADKILLDVKVGRGAFMKSEPEAKKLAELMQAIGNAFGKTVIWKLSPMDVPLGQAIGNLVEVKEVADLLRGKPADARLKKLVISLSDTALSIGGSHNGAESLISSGAAWKKFCEIIQSQGGEPESIDRWENVSPAAIVYSGQSGYVTDIDAERIGRSAMNLGAGRKFKEDAVDPLAGIWIDSVVGDFVEKGQPLAKLYCDPSIDALKAVSDISGAFSICDDYNQERRDIPNEIPAAQ